MYMFSSESIEYRGKDGEQEEQDRDGACVKTYEKNHKMLVIVERI